MVNLKINLPEHFLDEEVPLMKKCAVTLPSPNK